MKFDIKWQKTLWNFIALIPILVFLVIVFFIVNHYRSLAPKKNLAQAIGTVTGYQEGGTSGTYAIVTFYNDNNKFYAHAPDDYIIGEKFIIEYDEKHPEKNRVMLDKPILSDNEGTDIVVGIITTYNPNYFRKITFIYYVDGVQYEQSYEPSENLALNYPELREGKKFKVKYWKKNPKRSVLLLDKPATDIVAQ